MAGPAASSPHRRHPTLQLHQHRRQPPHQQQQPRYQVSESEERSVPSPYQNTRPCDHEDNDEHHDENHHHHRAETFSTSISPTGPDLYRNEEERRNGPSSSLVEQDSRENFPTHHEIEHDDHHYHPLDDPTDSEYPEEEEDDDDDDGDIEADGDEYHHDAVHHHHHYSSSQPVRQEATAAWNEPDHTAPWRFPGTTTTEKTPRPAPPPRHSIVPDAHLLAPPALWTKTAVTENKTVTMINKAPGISSAASSSHHHHHNSDLESPSTHSLLEDEEVALGGSSSSTSSRRHGSTRPTTNPRASAPLLPRQVSPPPTPPPGRPQRRRRHYRRRDQQAIWAACLYSFCSVGMILINKSLANSYDQFLGPDDDLSILLVVFQAVVAVVTLEVGYRCFRWVDHPPVTWKATWQWAPVNIFFCLMLLTSMAALQTNSVPMATVFRNVTNILTTAGDYVLFSSQPEGLVLVAFALMMVGSIWAAEHDITLTWIGMFWMVANCISTSGYVLYMKYAFDSVALSRFGMVWVNNLLCIVLLLPAATALGQVRVFLQTPQLHTMDYFFKNILAGVVGFLLNFASLNCVAVTGPTTYAIVGSLNKVPVALVGWFLYDQSISTETWFFLFMSMLGGFVFSWAQVQALSPRKSSKKTVEEVM